MEFKLPSIINLKHLSCLIITTSLVSLVFFSFYTYSKSIKLGYEIDQVKEEKVKKDVEYEKLKESKEITEFVHNLNDDDIDSRLQQYYRD